MPMWPPDTPPETPAQMPASAWDIQAPYMPGDATPVQVHGDADPGGRDKVSGTAAGSVAASDARLGELQSDTYGMGSTIGDLVMLPDVVSDHSLTTGGDGAGHPFEEDS